METQGGREIATYRHANFTEHPSSDSGKRSIQCPRHHVHSCRNMHTLRVVGFSSVRLCMLMTTEAGHKCT